MKLMIQIPCYNERNQLADTLAELPRQVPGIDEIEVLIVDDGSTDGTSEVAEQHGVHHIVRFPQNRGLSAAFIAGLEACLEQGADIIVNTDADNQYCAADIPQLIEPILAERADMVVGDRQTDSLKEFSALKRWLQKWGSSVVRRTSGLNVRDCTSGFRAFNRQAAARLFVHNRFTYTLETILQAGRCGLAIANVPVRTNPATRPSRLFRSIGDYLRRTIPVILHGYVMYWPLKAFGWLAGGLLAVGMLLTGRFLVLYLQAPDYSGHVQSLLVGMGCLILAFHVGLVAMLGQLIGSNRRLTEEVLARLRCQVSRTEQPRDPPGAGVGWRIGAYRTKAAAWNQISQGLSERSFPG